MWPEKVRRSGPSCGVPEPDRPVLTRRGDESAIGAERDARDAEQVAAERADRPPGRDVPDPDGPVAAGGRQPGAGGIEGQAVDGVVVAAERRG